MLRIRALSAFGIALGVFASSASAQWWWPPTNGMTVSPACPGPQSQIQMTVSGDWPDACIPNTTVVVVTGNEIDLNISRNPPPGFCLTVITPWSQQGAAGPLAAGTYTVFATYYLNGSPSTNRVQMGQFTVSASCGCYPDCNGDGLLNIADFGCFQTKFATGNMYADCNGDSLLNIADFGCFQTKFALGCP